MSIPPFGAHGLSDPQDASLPPAPDGPIVLSDDIDPQTGELLSLDGVHPVLGHVRWQFQVQARSGASVGRAGHRFLELKTIDSKTANSAKHEAARIFKQLGSDWVRLQPPNADTPAIRVDVDPASQTAAVEVDFFNVMQDKADQIARSLGGA